MPDIASEQKLLVAPGSGELLPVGWVRPNYEGRGFANIPATVGALFGARVGSLPPLDPLLWKGLAPGVERVVLVLVDGLGWRRLQRHSREEGDEWAARWREHGGVIAPLTSVCPSTTVAATTTLWTGEAPARHGLAGFTLHLREAGGVCDTIFFRFAISERVGELLEWGLEPAALVTVPGIGEQLGAAGIGVTALIQAAITNSPLSRIHYRGAERVVGHEGASDFWLRLREWVSARRGRRGLIVGYWGLVDHLSHLAGPEGAEWETEWRTLRHLLKEEFIARLTPAERRGTLLILTADHGQVQSRPEDYVFLKQHPALWDTFSTLPAGEPRQASFFLRPGAHAEALALIREELPGFWAAPTDSLLDGGIFGPDVWSETRLRLGELSVLSRGPGLLWFWPREPHFAGLHGALLPNEALVPWMALRLDH